MIQKVMKVGSSAAVTIPKKALKELGLKIGDSIIFNMNKENKIISYHSVSKQAKGQNKIAELTLNFVNRYREDLEALAR